ncbi:hypothetical protein BHE74_00029908 [Ensete ventricosum]|nr:hypothetical protein BHE74_00029908 [Ensete ventricosum]
MVTITHLLNVFHHNSFDFRNLSLDLGKLADLIGVVFTVLHLLFKLGPGSIESLSVLDEVVEGVPVTIVGELVVASEELLQALSGDAVEVARELGVLCQDHRPPRDEAVDQRLLPHLPIPDQTPPLDRLKRDGDKETADLGDDGERKEAKKCLLLFSTPDWKR